MPKEFMLVRRILWGIVLVALSFYIKHLFSSGIFVVLCLTTVAFSLLVQYFWLQPMLQEVPQKQQSLVLIIWFVITCCLGTFALHEIATLSWSQKIVPAMSIYELSIIMFVAGDCARRLFKKRTAFFRQAEQG
jgi:hypothetical protein